MTFDYLLYELENVLKDKPNKNRQYKVSKELLEECLINLTQLSNIKSVFRTLSEED